MIFLSPFGESCGHAVIKQFPEDFQVTEIPSYHPCGEGEHIWLEVTKTGVNTAWVAEQLSKSAGIRLRDVSYAGRKDKQAITTQWFSLHDPKRLIDPQLLAVDNCEFRKISRHSQKLRIGNLAGNHFTIRLREFNGDVNLFKKRFKDIVHTGFPNYFGLQRFGKRQNNLHRALKWVAQGAGRLQRDQRSLYISVLRSYIFNQVLTERIANSSWNKILDGECVQLSGSKSLFVTAATDEKFPELEQRCATFDLHPTGPLTGDGGLQPVNVVSEIENLVYTKNKSTVKFLNKVASASRRALRVLPENPELVQENGNLMLSFTLPPGSYATVLIDQLVEPVIN